MRRRKIEQLHDECVPEQQLFSGFVGQRIVKLPADVIRIANRQPLTERLMPTSVGFYPKAAGHLAKRPAGTSQTIFIYCLAGRGWCELGSCSHKIKAGQLLIIPPDIPHNYGADPKNPWTIYWFHAVGSQLSNFIEALSATTEQPVVFIGEDTLQNTLFEEVLTELEGGYTALNLIYVSQVLAHLLGAIIRRRYQSSLDTPDPRQKITHSIELMRSHLNRPLRILQLAAICNFSVAHFREQFKAQTGYGPKNYFTRLKVHKASQLLDSTGLSVKEIAHQVGFEDPLHFSRVFKHINALSPTDHRKRSKG